MNISYQASKLGLIGIFITILALLGSQASAATFLTNEELLVTIPGKTLYGRTNDGKKWVQTYNKGKRNKGKFSGIYDGEKYTGKWFIKNGQWCENWGEGNECRHVEQVKKNKLRTFKDGMPRKYLWTIK